MAYPSWLGQLHLSVSLSHTRASARAYLSDLSLVAVLWWRRRRAMMSELLWRCRSLLQEADLPLSHSLTHSHSLTLSLSSSLTFSLYRCRSMLVDIGSINQPSLEAMLARQPFEDTWLICSLYSCEFNHAAFFRNKAEEWFRSGFLCISDSHIYIPLVHYTCNRLAKSRTGWNLKNDLIYHLHQGALHQNRFRLPANLKIYRFQ